MPLLSPDDNQMSMPDERGGIPKANVAGELEPGLLGAAMRRSNIAGTLWEQANHPQPTTPSQPGFDPETNVPKGYEPVADIFAGARNSQDIEWRRQQFDREMTDNKIIQSHHGWGVAATMAAGMTDPLTIASMAIPLAGEARLARFGSAAITAGATSAAQEAVMQELEVSRTGKESALNVAASAVLGGVLGAVLRPRVPASRFAKMAEEAHEELHGAGGEQVMGPIDGRTRIMPESDLKIEPPHPASEQAYLAKGEYEALAQSEDRTIKDVGPLAAESYKPITELPEVGAEWHVNPTEEQSFGAAGVTTPTIRGESIARGAGFMSNTIDRVSVGGRLLNSPSLTTRKITQDLMNVPELLEKNYQGVASASPIERELWKYEGTHITGMNARDAQFKTYRARIAGEGGTPLSRGEFNDQISKAMRRGDTHAVPEIAQAAKDTRRIVFDPLKERATKLGLLPEDVKATGADSYLMRQYDSQKIKANQTDWLDRLHQGFVAQGVDSAEARDIAHQANRNVLGSERGTMDFHTMDGIVPKSGRLKERTLKLPDTLLEPYLNSDIDHLSHSYLRSMAPEVELTERFGSRDLKDQVSAIHDDYARMTERAKTDAEKKSLYSKMEKDLRDITAVRDRLYGTYGAPKDPGHFMVRSGRLMRSVNVLRMLGTATVSHFPDLANAIMRFGAGRTFGTIGKMLTSSAAFKLGKSEAQRLGAAIDMVGPTISSMLGDYGTHSRYPEQKWANYLSRKFTVLTGETPLIVGMQSITATLAHDHIIRSAQRLAAGGSMSANRMANFAAAGLDADMLKRIAAQHEQFGAKVNGLTFGMSDQWTDKVAASKFESAVIRDAHSVTLRPGVGDTPLFMSTEWGKALKQFSTFAYAAKRSVVNPLMQGLAHGDPRAAEGLMALIAMGTLSYVTKQHLSGQPIEEPTSPKFAAEVLDKSNMLGWMGEYIFPGMWMLGMKNLSRWSDRSAAETLGGPVVGTAFNAYEQRLPAKALAMTGLPNLLSGTGFDMDEKGLSRGDLHFLRRMTPGQNLWYLRNHINSLEDAIGDGFDLPGKSNADRAEENRSH